MSNIGQWEVVLINNDTHKEFSIMYYNRRKMLHMVHKYKNSKDVTYVTTWDWSKFM